MAMLGLLVSAGCAGGDDGEALPATTIAPATTSATATTLPPTPATAAPTSGVPADPCDTAGADADTVRACVRLHQIQVIGTHNSYKGPVPPAIFPLLAQFDPELAAELEYEHPPLDVQLGQEAVRQIELDVFADPDGGLFAGRAGLAVAGVPNDAPPSLLEPGFKVLHVQDLDYETSCVRFVECLEQVRAWSQEHPGHIPIAILVELKDSPIPDPLEAGFVVPLPIGAAELDALDAEIRSVFADDDLITPDDVRGDAATLEAAVLDGRWPTLAEASGKVLFLMDNGGALRDVYREGRPLLEGRVMFTSAFPGEPDAAFVKVNDPLADPERIPSLVAAGYVVRTRADVPTQQARSGDTTQRDAALASGAQWVSTDYPVPGRSPFSDYHASIPGSTVARCNPVATSPACVDRLLEDLG